MGNAALDKSDALLLDKLSNQNMEISHLLVRSRKAMIYHKMDLFWVPDLLNPHLAKDLDRQGSSTILGHSHVRGKNSDLAGMMDLLTSISLDTDYLLSKRQGVIVEDRLRQLGQGRNQNSRY